MSCRRAWSLAGPPAHTFLSPLLSCSRDSFALPFLGLGGGLPDRDKVAGVDGSVAGAALGIQEIDDFLQRVSVCCVPKKRAFSSYPHQILVLKFVEMMRQGRGGNPQFILNVTNNEPLGVSGQQELHDAQSRLRTHG